MKVLTIITTTYNRAYCLHQVYDSLIHQESRYFKWMIVDDGSTDNTKELVEKWIAEKKIEIEYFFKPNGGMHTARNMAYEKVDTELNVIIDSDDWMVDDAVSIIVEFWKLYKSDRYAGIIAQNITKEKKLVSSSFPKAVSECTISEFRDKYNIKGDAKLIYRSELTKLFPYPEFEGEKFYPPSYKFRLLDLNYKMLILAKPVCVVDYNGDSMTYNKFEQYRSCCNGFSHYRNEMIRISKSPKYIIKQMIHYVAESKMANKMHYIMKSSKPLYAVLCWPLGLFYYFYVNNTKRRY